MAATRVASIALFLVAALLRIHNAWVALPLSGYDGPYHAAYIGILHFEGRVPLQHESWSTFHPPLYYALCDLIWRLLPGGWEPHTVLFTLRLVNVAFSLALGLAVYRSARLLFPDREHLALYALALVLFVPMHVGPSVQIGNEMAATSLSALSVLLLLRALAGPEDRWRPVALGALLALALLSKFSAAVVAIAAIGTLAVQGIARSGWRPGALRAPAVTGLVVLLATAPYFGRNLLHYGTPSLVHVDLSANAMRRSGFGEPRPWHSYTAFHTDILRDPSSRHPRAVRAVWPVTFATTWFDVHHTVIDPRHPWSRRFAPFLFSCGALISALSLVGLGALWTRRVRPAVPFATLSLSMLSFLALAAYVAFTHRVATFSVLKGIYLDPALAAFCLFAAVGFDLMARLTRATRHLVHAFLALFVASVVTLFWIGGLAPMALSPAPFYLRAYSDAPTQRAFDYFVGRGPRGGRRPGGGRPSGPP
jgi:4-amino-4-deoxy-L-arabinose transferase-like glycosyltransferase